jgi:hypothetical protein
MGAWDRAGAPSQNVPFPGEKTMRIAIAAVGVAFAAITPVQATAVALLRDAGN